MMDENEQLIEKVNYQARMLEGQRLEMQETEQKFR
jgi:hypothetical protein